MPDDVIEPYGGGGRAGAGAGVIAGCALALVLLVWFCVEVWRALRARWRK